MANSISIDDDGAQAVKSDEKIYAELQQAYRDILSNGQNYTIVGSRTFSGANIAELKTEMLRYERRILRKKGADSRNRTDFSTSDGASTRQAEIDI